MAEYYQEAQGMSMGSVVGSMLNPMNVLYFPGMASWEKGFKDPFNLGHKAAAMFSKRGLGTPGGIGKAINIMADGGPEKLGLVGRTGKVLGGAWRHTLGIKVDGQQWWNPYAEGSKSSTTAIQSKINKNTKFYKDVSAKLQKIRKDSAAKYGQAYLVSNSANPINSVADDAAKARATKLQKKIHGKLRSGYKMEMRSAQFGKFAFKGAIGAFKVASTVAMLSLAWDVSKAIAEPMGRSIVGTMNSVIGSFNDRFSMDMGGKLAMGFLSNGAATERQRAISMISKSQLNARSAMGQEAMAYHR